MNWTKTEYMRWGIIEESNGDKKTSWANKNKKKDKKETKGRKKHIYEGGLIDHRQKWWTEDLKKKIKEIQRWAERVKTEEMKL